MFPEFMVGVVTKDRYDTLSVLLKSLREHLSSCIVVDASDNLGLDTLRKFNFHCGFYNVLNKPVVFNKNLLMRFFLENSDRDYLFIVEDDIKILDPDVFYEYIRVSKKHGIPHLVFSEKGDKDCTYKLNEDVDVHEHAQGAFNFYTRECLERTGMMDERFCHNCWEHLEHTARIHREFGYRPAFWHFPDVAASFELLKYQRMQQNNNLGKTNDEWLKKDRLLFMQLMGWDDFPPLSKKMLAIEKS